ncbi:hypothetical protein [Granulicella tundricola]|uniref:Outer membrane protein beta-barrel domain-containing protein n=1 Tax=Granulicella tundricola (strain ATCC BAA-1859 / DSM 23138 / MP5ACTX9) TaxID=1198114 RepID=E8X5G3_GRATM|nr:hypothetical protein [Granulicella tundricola]ADW69510.1 hypothetical protein AciX9_2477 [Granulicella tundricola MP5ACTX9]
MRISPNFTFLSLLLLAPAAHAQLSAYVTFSPAHLSNIETGAVSTATGTTEQTASYWSSGIGGGITFPILHLPIVALNVDLRGSTRPGTNGVDSALVGLQLAVHPHVISLKPYIEVAGGYLNTRTTNVSTNPSTNQPVGGTFGNQYAAYEILGGVDHPILPFIDWRIVEIGVGQGFNVPGITTNGKTYNATVVTANTGLVIHF